jgi:cation-transporting ATPase 13A1
MQISFAACLPLWLRRSREMPPTFQHPPDSIRSLRLLRKRRTLFNLGWGIEHFVFAILYALAAQQCIATVGQPYAAALAHASARREALESATAALAAAAGGLGAGATRGEEPSPLPPPPPAEEAEDFDPWATGDDAPLAVAADNATAAAWGDTVSFGAPPADGGGGDDDEEDKPPPLPSPMLPAFWAMVLTAAVALLHALSQLAQHWSMAVRVALRYAPQARVADGATLLVTPPAHQGRAALVLLQAFAGAAGGGGGEGLFFIFQRQRYELAPEPPAGGGSAAADECWAVRQLPYRVSEPLTFYLSARGLGAADAVDAPGTLRSRFGANDFHVPIPRLRDLFVEQLLGPVTQFQLFSALLWVLDEYWKYALFNGGMILMFEATTAVSRLKSLQTLRGMGSRARPVYALRDGAWVAVGSDALLPGDIVSLTAASGGAASASAAAAAAGTVAAAAAPQPPEEEPLVPCDCLILSGAAVANEASLTGESIPQLKEGARADGAGGGSERLDLASADQRVCVLFSGTSLMRHTGGGGSGGRPAPPDGGVVCYVLRTGFASSQGALMRMIEFSQEQVTGDSRETLVLLLILLAFALLSAAHVLRTGLAEGKRSQYELLLRCVFILTSVVPPELPMQTALAVNTSLMALHKAGVFCTEPYRIPLAGKVDTCLFDKTGTLTTDKLVAQGIVCWDAPPATATATAAAPPSPPQPRALATLSQASLEAAMVLAGCHSLLEIGGKLVGDPIEVEALRAAGWGFSAEAGVATPKALKAGEPARPWPASAAPVVRILHRYHFSSALQRMAVLARVSGLPGGPSGGATYALVKGSAEAVARLLAVKPEGYDETYRPLAARGMRVLALALKPMPAAGGGSDEPPRDAVEAGLRFVGFVAFSCRVRQDTAGVVAKLRAGGTSVAMATGDDPLTALHVAREVGICSRNVAAAVPPASRAPPPPWYSEK